jgi:Outer membrane protein beta-barrel domain
MFVRRGAAVFAAIVFVLGFQAAPARAQSWSITPWLGYSFPTGDVGNFSDADEELKISQGSGFAFGGFLGYDGAGKIGFDFGLGYLSSDVEAEFCEAGDCTDVGDESSSVITLNGRVRYMFSGPEAQNKFYGAAGLAYLMRGGDGYEDVDGADDIGISLAIGMRRPLTEMMQLVVEFEDVLFSGELDEDFGGGVESNSNINNHFTLRGGVRIPFGG